MQAAEGAPWAQAGAQVSTSVAAHESRHLSIKTLRHLMFKMTRVESGSTLFRGPTVNQHMREREAEKTADLETLARISHKSQVHRGSE